MVWRTMSVAGVNSVQGSLQTIKFFVPAAAKKLLWQMLISPANDNVAQIDWSVH